jgi:hypothetical protein
MSNYTPTPAEVAANSFAPEAYRVYSRWVKRGETGGRSVLAAIREAYACGATAERAALAAAGRLQPEPTEIRTEWGIQISKPSALYGDGVEVHTESAARRISAERGKSPVRRVVGPWLPVPEPTCTCPDCDVSTVGERPGTSTIKGLDPACRIHGKLSVWCACKPGTTCGYHLAHPATKEN